MIKNNCSLSQVKATIEKMREKEVDVRVNLGRNKYVSFSGKLVGVYPALFTVSPTDKNFRGKTTYSYSEYMCGKVKLVEK
ncbi:MAG: Veg family protein [Clostridia bacterium]|nr:Veg family protein [Clostridia bacterium]